MADKLTAKQEAFARAYVETGNASEAYRQAYNAENMKPESIWVEACRTLADPNVSLKVFELQKSARERTLVTIESITWELEQVREAAFNEGDYAPANTAIMGKAKVNGLLVDKQETKSEVTVKTGASDKIKAMINEISQRTASDTESN